MVLSTVPTAPEAVSWKRRVGGWAVAPSGMGPGTFSCTTVPVIDAVTAPSDPLEIDPVPTLVADPGTIVAPAGAWYEYTMFDSEPPLILPASGRRSTV